MKKIFFMTNQLEKLISKLSVIANDRSSGALDIVFAISDVVLDALNNRIINNNTRKVLMKALKVLKIKQGAFIVVNKLISSIESILDTTSDPAKQLYDFIIFTKEYYERLSERQADKFLKLGIDTRKILVHSNSYSVKHFLLTLKKKGVIIQEIIQTASLPGNEGILQADCLKKYAFQVRIIGDEQVTTVMKNIDVVFLGSDLILNDSFINKVKTLYICKYMRQANIPVYVLADKNKIISHEEEQQYKTNLIKITDKEGNKLFEEIPKKAVTGFLIP